MDRRYFRCAIMSNSLPNDVGSIQPTVAIVGGGITGLCVANRLEKLLGTMRPLPAIALFEASDRLGGKIETCRDGEMVLETGAESFLARKAAGIRLCQELDLAGRLIETRADTKRTFIFCGNELHQLPEGMTGFVPSTVGSIFSCHFLSSLGKMRMAMDFVLPARRSATDESLAHFMTRRFGGEAYRCMIEPLLCGIYSGDGSQLSLTATYPQLRKLEQKYGSIIRGLLATKKSSEAEKAFQSPFVTLPNGLSELIQAITSRLRFVRLHLSSPVVSIERRPTVFKLNFANRNSQLFENVVLTGSSLQSAALLSSESPELASELRAIPHVSTATVNLWYDSETVNHPMQGYGFVIPSGEQRFVTAVTWTSSKHWGRAPLGVKLLRAFVGRDGAELDLRLSDTQIVDGVRDDLQRTMGIRAIPRGCLVRRWPMASPQYRLGHLGRLSRIDELLKKWPRLYLCGASYRGVGIPDCIADGERAADRLAVWLQSMDHSR